MAAAPERILLVRLSHLGDVVLALPVLHAARRAQPRARIAWAVQPEFASLLQDMPGLERLFLFDRRGGLAAWSKLRRELGDWSADLCIDVQGNVKSAMVAMVSGAPRRLGLAPADWAEPFAAGVLTESAPPAAGRHGMQRALALAAVLDPDHAPRFDPGLSAAEREQGRAELERRFPGTAPGWILSLSDDRDLRSWPSAVFAELAERLALAGASVLLLSGPRERALGERLRDAPSGARTSIGHWVGQRGLRELAAVFAEAAERGHRLVACDSGPAHLAASVGLPVDLIAGPQDPARTGPWPPASAAGIGVDGRRAHRFVQRSDPPACMPCLSRRCDHPRGPVCLSELDAGHVASLLLQGAPCA